jgi:FkbM family methyltransferase
MKLYIKVDWQGKEPAVMPFDIEVAGEEDLMARLMRESQAFYEVRLLRYLARRGPCGGVYVDAGASIGNHAVFFGAFLAEFVVAIEPSPELARLLRRNLAANGITKASVVECAVGATPGWGRLWLPQRHNVGSTRVLQAEPGADSASDGVVEISTVDRVIDSLTPRLGYEPVSLLKIDVEGMECDVLMGAANVLRYFRPQLVVELKDSESFAAVTTWLADHGYCAVAWFGPETSRTYYFINPAEHRLRMLPCELHTQPRKQV